jgi:CBS domain containing-hemolysin-like protein
MATLMTAPGAEPQFAASEKEMLRSVLTLVDRKVQTVMTPRREVEWLDASASAETVLAKIRESPHRHFVVSRDAVDEIMGIVRKDDLLAHYLTGRPLDLLQIMRDAVVVHEGASILRTIELFKREPADLAVVVDEYGGVQGIATRTDVLEAIAGDLSETVDDEPAVKDLGNGEILVDGALSLHVVQSQLDLRGIPEGEFNTLAGFVLSLFGRVPKAGETVAWRDWHFTVSEMDGLRITSVVARRATVDAALNETPTNP